MSKHVSIGKSHHKQNGWDFVIQACLNQIGEHEARAARLKTSLEYFEMRKKSGDLFPGVGRLQERGLLQVENQNPEPCHTV
jgi:hypothetical protein